MAMTFHQLCRAGFISRQSRTGETDGDLADAINAMHGTDYTGADIAAMHVEGYPSTVMDMVAETIGRNCLDLIAQAMQMVMPGPHVACPSCTCGLSAVERDAVSAAYLISDAAGRRALQEVRAAQGFQQPIDCASCGVDTQTA